MTGLHEQLTIEQSYPAMYYEVKEFVDLINQGKMESDINSFENSYTTMLVVDRVRAEIGLKYPSDEKLT